MCEIFVLKKKKGLIFPKSALEGAMHSNSDGAGFVVFDFDKKKEKWEVVDFDLFKPSKKKYTYENYQWDNIAMCGKGSEHIDEETEEMEKAYLKSELSKKDFLELYPEDADDYEEDEEIEEATITPTKTEIGFVASREKENVEVDEQTLNAIFERQKRMKAGQMMITHFRLSTSGHTHDNTQPILNGDYITIHNGIFAYKSEPAGYSDTRHFSELLKNESKKLQRITPKAEQKIIEKLLKEAGGYYSIFIYSFKTGQIYYYKSRYASFSWSYNGLMGATKESRFPIKYYSAQEKEVIKL